VKTLSLNMPECQNPRMGGAKLFPSAPPALLRGGAWLTKEAGKARGYGKSATNCGQVD